MLDIYLEPCGVSVLGRRWTDKTDST